MSIVLVIIFLTFLADLAVRWRFSNDSTASVVIVIVIVSIIEVFLIVMVSLAGTIVLLRFASVHVERSPSVPAVVEQVLPSSGSVLVGDPHRGGSVVEQVLPSSGSVLVGDPHCGGSATAPLEDCASKKRRQKTLNHRIRLESALARDRLVRRSIIDPSIHVRHHVSISAINRNYLFVGSAPIGSILRRRQDPHNASRRVSFGDVVVQRCSFDFETPTKGCTLVEAAKGFLKERGTIDQYEKHRLGHRFPNSYPTNVAFMKWKKCQQEASLNPPVAVDDPVGDVVIQPAQTADDQAEPMDWEPVNDEIQHEEPRPAVSIPAVSTLNGGVPVTAQKYRESKRLRPARTPKYLTNYYPVPLLGSAQKPKSVETAAVPNVVLEVILEVAEADEQNVVREESHVTPLAMDDPVWDVVIQPAQTVDDLAKLMNCKALNNEFRPEEPCLTVSMPTKWQTRREEALLNPPVAMDDPVRDVVIQPSQTVDDQAMPMDWESIDDEIQQGEPCPAVVAPVLSALNGGVQGTTRKCHQSKRLRPSRKMKMTTSTDHCDLQMTLSMIVEEAAEDKEIARDEDLAKCHSMLLEPFEDASLEDPSTGLVTLENLEAAQKPPRRSARIAAMQSRQCCSLPVVAGTDSEATSHGSSHASCSQRQSARLAAKPRVRYSI
jgi:hypothetical protein